MAQYMIDDKEKLKIPELKVIRNHTTTSALAKAARQIRNENSINPSQDYDEVKINEHELTENLKVQLREKFEWINIFKNPSSSKTVRNYLCEKLGYVPILQPEIDKIFLEESFNLNAVEIKLFKSMDINYKMRFYKGIDQALALNRYGFDHVALWHFFYPNIKLEEINKYGAEAWYLVRDSLDLPLDFQYFRILFENSEFQYQVLQYVDRNKGFFIGKTLDNPEFTIEWKHKNPLRNDRVSVIIREAFIKYMNILTKNL